jgi:hypothetical protein
MKNEINAQSATTGIYATRSNSIVAIFSNDDFTFESGDSWGNQASVGWKDSIAKISDLPATMDGFDNDEVPTIAVTGTDRDTFTNYYLSWDTDHWKETHEDGSKIILDTETMPAKLVQVSSNPDVFEFGFLGSDFTDGYGTIIEPKVVWEDRIKGDEDSNPMPSFVGTTITNMFFFKNRLGFTSGENVILSETASYYNFFATTVMELLDSDPIDAAVDSSLYMQRKAQRGKPPRDKNPDDREDRIRHL